jgi:hypothetical protein
MRAPREWDPEQQRWLRIGPPRRCLTCDVEIPARFAYCAHHAPTRRAYMRRYQRRRADELREYQREYRGHRPLLEVECGRCGSWFRTYLGHDLCNGCRIWATRREVRYGRSG